MNQRFNSGFTIIEVSLFLAISGLLSIGILVGLSATIQSHRYKDSVASLQSYLQHQFSKVENLENSREGSEYCNNNAQTSTISSERRGTSECVVVGRYIALEGQSASSYSVVAMGSSDEQLNDIEDLKQYKIKIDELAPTEEEMRWGGSIVTPKSSTGGREPLNIYLLIIRSPKSGYIYTFSSSNDVGRTSTGELSVMVKNKPEAETDKQKGRTQQYLCVDPSGNILVSRMGILIEPNLSNANGIQIISNDTAGEGLPQC